MINEPNLKHRIENDFTYHAPKPEQVAFYNSFREDAKALALRIEAEVPACRERSLALTKLEEVVMWSNAAVARNS